MKHPFDDIKLLLESASKFPVKTEWRFHAQRQWRFDYAIPELKLAIEIEGDVFINERHTRGTGYIRDMEKYNIAQIMGWTVLRYTPDQRDKMFDEVREYVGGKKVS